MARRTKAVDQDQDRNNYPEIRALMDHTEATLFDALVTTRIVNPEQDMYALHFACAEGELTAVKRLVEQKADQNHRFLDLPSGSTPLHWAASTRSAAIVAYLVSKGADVNAQTKHGKTALHLACRAEDVEIVTSLVQAGANVNAIDKQGSKPVAYLTFDPNQRHSTHYYERIQAQLGDIKVARRESRRVKMEDKMDAIQAQTQKVVSLTSARAPAAGVTRTISLKGLARVASVHGQLMKLEPPKPPPKGHVSIVFKDEAGELERFETTRLVVMKRRTGRLAKEVDLAVSAAGSAILPRSKTAAADAGDKGVVIQLERSPLAFPFVLGFLENTSQGSVADLIPRGMDLLSLKRLHADAEFFELPDLAKICAVRMQRLQLRRVDPLGSGQHVSIRSAVIAAEGGETILIEPGVYEEAFEVTKSLTFLSNGADQQSVVIRGGLHGDATVVVAGAALHLQGISIERFRPDRKTLGCVVQVQRGGTLLMEDGKITGNVDYGLYIHDRARANLQRVQVYECAGTGIHCAGSVTMDKCQVTRAANVGIAMVGEGAVQMRRCTVTDCADCGMLVQGTARGTLTANRFANNGLAGIAVSSRSTEFSVRMNVLADNAQGLLVFEGGTPLVSNSELCNNSVAGLVIISGGNPVVTSCKIANNKGCGVLVDADGLGEVRMCDITENGLAGVAVKNNGNPSVDDCTIANGQDAGLLVYDSGKGSFRDCEIARNALAGVAISKDGDPTLIGCTVHSCNSGISVVEGGHGTFKNVEVHDNATCQVEVVDCRLQPPVLEECIIGPGPSLGVMVRSSGTCIMSNSSISGNALIGLLVHGAGATGTFTNVLIEKNKVGGAHFSDSAEPRMIGAKVRENGGTGVMVKTGSVPVLQECTIEGNAGVGIWFAHESYGMVDRCEVVSNSTNIMLEGFSGPTIKDSSILLGKDGGIMVTRGAKGTIRECLVQNNKPYGIAIGDGANPVVFLNRVFDNSPYGVLVMAEGVGHIYANKIRRCQLAPIVLAASARTVVADNQIDPTNNGVHCCWADEEQRVRPVELVQLQRLAIGDAVPEQRTVRQRLSDHPDKSIEVLIEEAKTARAVREALVLAETEGEEPLLVEAGVAGVAQSLSVIDQQLHAIEAEKRGISTLPPPVRTPTPAQGLEDDEEAKPGQELLKAQRALDHKASVRECATPPPVPNLDAVSAPRKEYTAPKAPPEPKAQALVQEEEEEEEEEQEEGARPEGMGMPFGLAM